jgi:hypothetical protein
MQINYENYPYLRTAGFWNYPQIYNASQEIDVPPIYAPYGTPGFWPDGTRPSLGEVAPPETFTFTRGLPTSSAPMPASASSIAPNSGQNNTVAAAMSASSSEYFANLPPTPAIAAATGTPLAPVSLVSPMPSITAIPNPVTSQPSGFCSINSWVASNPMLAAAGVFGLFLLLKGGKR